MKKTIGTLLVCIALACVVSLAAADNTQSGPLTGTWNCVSHGGQQGEMKFTLDLQQNGENVSGDVSSPLGDADLSSGNFKDNRLTVTIDGNTETYTLTATLKDGKLAGHWSTSESGEKGTWEGTKAAASQQ